MPGCNAINKRRRSLTRLGRVSRQAYRHATATTSPALVAAGRARLRDAPGAQLLGANVALGAEGGAMRAGRMGKNGTVIRASRLGGKKVRVCFVVVACTFAHPLLAPLPMYSRPG